MRKRLWRPTKAVWIAEAASAVGKQEYEGPYGQEFDFHDETDLFGGDTWEHAEGNLSHTVLNLLYKKAGLSHRDIDLLFSGDLQNQCVASAEGHVEDGIPYIGIYGACSTVCEGLILGTIALNANQNLQNACIVTTSHNCVAERQFRLPLEYGGQRTPTAQWTATAGGGFLLTRESGKAQITEAMPGVMVDMGQSDAANMGAAMAPAVVNTLAAYFAESGRTAEDFDCIVTGDLGFEGAAILSELCKLRGIPLKDKHLDCGALLYDKRKHDVHAGGSGCGCSASLLAAHFVPALARGDIRRMLFMATGALMSTASIQQGGHIIGIAPLITLETAQK